MPSLNLLQGRQEHHRAVAAHLNTLPKSLMHGLVSTRSCVTLKHALTDQDLQFELINTNRFVHMQIRILHGFI